MACIHKKAEYLSNGINRVGLLYMIIAQNAIQNDFFLMSKITGLKVYPHNSESSECPCR